MSRIQVLSQYTANQIAAGEVVERPASVVKELLENSIDAHSTSVTIEIKNGGIDYIRITDNGGGIEHDDVQTAFLRHATSKINNADDLSHIETLGFRGEALASIAAVAHIVMRTRTPSSESGTLIRVNGGDVSDISEVGCVEGTTIEVSNLFYNVPARLKFLKSARAEASYISDYVSRMIMARPDISIKFIQNDKTVFHSAGSGDISNALYCVYGKDIFPHLRNVDYDDGYVKLSGVIGTDEIARSNRTHQSFYINGRYIKSQKLSMAVFRAYDTRIMVGRFPFIVMNIAIAADEIDVNVHPNKLDIRFKDEERVMRAATIAARMALGDPVAPIVRSKDVHILSTGLSTSEASFDAVPHTEVDDVKRVSRLADNVQPSVSSNEEHSFDRDAALAAVSERISSQTSHESLRVGEALCDEGRYTKSGYSRETESLFSTRKGELSSAFDAEKRTDSKAFEAVEIVSEQTRELNSLMPETQKQTELLDTSYRVAGRLFDCYWLVEQRDSVFIIDQHAAHERILYEKYMRGELRSDSQMLLIPTVMKLSPTDFECLIENIEQFVELGFDIEEFGAYTVSIRAVPHIMGQPETEKFLYDAIGAISASKRATSKEVKRASIIQAACKHAVKAGDPLPNDEIESLITSYMESGVPMTCPHGRPVMIVMERGEFQKLFKRIV